MGNTFFTLFKNKKYIHILFITKKNKNKLNYFFFSSGYDHVLLVSYLVPYLFEKRFYPKLERRGNKITTIRTRSNIVFRDITKLLAPSTNLRSFGKLFNLEQEKAHFPFGYLTSVTVLTQTKLPTNPKLWKSELSGSDSVGPNEIAEAEKLFDSKKCKNIGDYLKTYLELDVDILYKATQEWRKQLKNLLGVDFIECGKYTISGLSNYAGHKCMAENLRLGSFFPNNSQNYRILRNGMRG